MDDGFDLWDSQNYECWFQAVIDQGQWVQRTSSANDVAPKVTSPAKTSSTPFCKNCNIQMVIRTNRQTEQQFYGCPNYHEKRCKSIPLKNRSLLSSWSRSISEAEENAYEEYARDIGDR